MQRFFLPSDEQLAELYDQCDQQGRKVEFERRQNESMLARAGVLPGAASDLEDVLFDCVVVTIIPGQLEVEYTYSPCKYTVLRCEGEVDFPLLMLESCAPGMPVWLYLALVTSQSGVLLREYLPSWISDLDRWSSYVYDYVRAGNRSGEVYRLWLSLSVCPRGNGESLDAFFRRITVEDFSD